MVSEETTETMGVDKIFTSFLGMYNINVSYPFLREYKEAKIEI